MTVDIRRSKENGDCGGKDFLLTLVQYRIVEEVFLLPRYMGVVSYGIFHIDVFTRI